PSASNLRLYSHLHPTGLAPGGRSTKVQTSLVRMESISISMASCHFPESLSNKASSNVLGSPTDSSVSPINPVYHSGGRGTLVVLLGSCILDERGSVVSTVCVTGAWSGFSSRPTRCSESFPIVGLG